MSDSPKFNSKNGREGWVEGLVKVVVVSHEDDEVTGIFGTFNRYVSYSL